MYKLILKCVVLTLLEKEEASTAGPVGVSSVGYMNPVFSGPVLKLKTKKKKQVKI
jgi:hypothetical protein